MPWIIAENVAVNQNTGDVVTEVVETRHQGQQDEGVQELGGVVAAAAHVDMETQGGIEPAVVKEFAALVRQLAPTLGLSSKDQFELESAASETEAVASAPDASKSVVRRGVERAVAAIKLGGPGLAQKAVLGAADELLVHLTEEGIHQIGF